MTSASEHQAFQCTKCGACCAKVQGHYVESLKPYGGLKADGSCSNYDRWTKKCNIYENRPDICRVEKTCPPDWKMQDHFSHVEAYCDKVHLQVYGSQRERAEDCYHERPEIRLQLETVSTCNAACHFCPYPDHPSRRGKTMDMDLFHKIVDEAATIPHISIYSMQGLGEPLLDKNIVDRVAYIKTKDPNCKMELFTNGVMAGPNKLDLLQRAGLDCIVFSLNANNAAQHEQVMKLKGKYDTVVENIRYSLKLPWITRIHAVEDGKYFTMLDTVEFRATWGEHCKPCGVGNWAGDRPFNYGSFKPNECCERALSTIYVMYDGRCSQCCFDPLGEGAVFGDLNKQTIREIYASERYVKFREDHFTNNADRWERCRGCSRI